MNLYNNNTDATRQWVVKAIPDRDDGLDVESGTLKWRKEQRGDNVGKAQGQMKRNEVEEKN